MSNTNSLGIQTQSNSVEEFSKKPVRFDKLFSEYGFNFNDFGNDGQLMFDLVVYFASQHQNNFFGFGKLNVDDFCKTMKYNKTNLLRAHENPYQFQLKSDKKAAFERLNQKTTIANGKDAANKNEFFYTVLDNALYRLYQSKISFGDENSQYIAHNKKEILKKVSLQGGVVVIEELSKFYVESKTANNGINKVLYSFRLNPIFLENLTTFYLNINIDSIAKLRQSNSVFLYTYLKNLETIIRAQGKSYSDTTSFDELVNKAEIGLKSQKDEDGKGMSPSDKKKILRNKILNIFKVSDLKGEITFVKRANSKDNFKFQPVITFTGDYAKKGDSSYNDSILHAATTRFLHKLKDHFINIGGSETNGPFSDWYISAYESKVGDQRYTELRTMAKFVYSEVVGLDVTIGDTRITKLMDESYSYIVDKKNQVTRNLNT